MQTSEENRGRTYCIALNFWGSKFSRIVVFEDFVLLKWFHEFAAHACCTCNMLWVWHTSLASVFNMHHAVTLLSSQSHSCQQSNAYFEGISLERVHWEPQDVFHWHSCNQNMKTVSRVKIFSWNTFANSLKFAKFTKLKTCENLALYSTYEGLYLILANIRPHKIMH